jgi:hypothetical protein
MLLPISEDVVVAMTVVVEVVNPMEAVVVDIVVGMLVVVNVVDEDVVVVMTVVVEVVNPLRGVTMLQFDILFARHTVPGPFP